VLGKGVEVRTGVFILSHDEITRMLAEHGTLGILLLLILFALVLYLENSFIMFYVVLCRFLGFNDQPCGDANCGPAFVYSLALLNVQWGDEQKVSDQ
jgi:hypothetical protein